MDRPAGIPSRRGSGPDPANFSPLTPTSFLDRAAAVYPRKAAVIHGERTFTYAELHARTRRLASVLARRGIGSGDTVAVIAPNVPAMLEAHYGVPMAGAVLNTLNYRLDARTIAFILQHANAKLLIADTEFSDTVGPALRAPAATDAGRGRGRSARGPGPGRSSSRGW